MGKINATYDIAAPHEKVFGAFASPATYEQWMTTHTKWKSEIPETFAVGTRTDEVVTMLGMANTISWTVTEFEAPTRMTISGTGMAGVTTTFQMSVADNGSGGTTAQIDAEFDGSMITGALGKAVEKDAQANLDESLAKLAALVTA